MRYVELSMSEGREFFPKVLNLFPKPLTDDDFYVEPWENRELADCAEFRLGSGTDGSDEVLFFVSDPPMIDFLSKSTGDIYLFGAYNQINVCQMRARGNVTLVESDSDAQQIKARLHAAIEKRVGALFNGLDTQEAAERYALLSEGSLFRFRITTYATHMYERG